MFIVLSSHLLKTVKAPHAGGEKLRRNRFCHKNGKTSGEVKKKTLSRWWSRWNFNKASLASARSPGGFVVFSPPDRCLVSLWWWFSRFVRRERGKLFVTAVGKYDDKIFSACTASPRHEIEAYRCRARATTARDWCAFDFCPSSCSREAKVQQLRGCWRVGMSGPKENNARAAHLHSPKSGKRRQTRKGKQAHVGHRRPLPLRLSQECPKKAEDESSRGDISSSLGNKSPRRLSINI